MRQHNTGATAYRWMALWAHHYRAPGFDHFLCEYFTRRICSYGRQLRAHYDPCDRTLGGTVPGGPTVRPWPTGLVYLSVAPGPATV